MLKFAANLSFLYNELPFLDRFEAAAKDGFKGVEYLFPYAHSPQEIASALQHSGLQQVLFNAPPAGANRDGAQAAWDQGVRGTTCLPGREDEFRQGFLWALEYAEVLQCPRIHVMAGLVPEAMRQPSHLPPHLSTSSSHAATPGPLRDTYVRNLRWAAEQAAAFDAYILQDKYLSKHRGEYAVRGAVFLPFVNRMDLSLTQDLFRNLGGKRHTAQIRLDIQNFGNMLNSDWGVSQRLLANQILTNAAADSNGKVSYRMAVVNGALPTSSLQATTTSSDVYTMMLSFRYSFR